MLVLIPLGVVGHSCAVTDRVECQNSKGGETHFEGQCAISRQPKVLGRQWQAHRVLSFPDGGDVLWAYRYRKGCTWAVVISWVWVCASTGMCSVRATCPTHTSLLYFTNLRMFVEGLGLPILKFLSFQCFPARYSVYILCRAASIPLRVSSQKPNFTPSWSSKSVVLYIPRFNFWVCIQGRRLSVGSWMTTDVSSIYLFLNIYVHFLHFQKYFGFLNCTYRPVVILLLYVDDVESVQVCSFRAMLCLTE